LFERNQFFSSSSSPRLSNLLSFCLRRGTSRFRARRHNFAIAYSPHHSLYQPVYAFMLRVIRIEKAELRLTASALIRLDRQFPAKIIFNERRFVP
jgi:hypothetical protein